MGIADIRDPEAAFRAIAECDRLGAVNFREKYGVGKSHHYKLRDIRTDRYYDPAPVIAAAHGYVFPDGGPLSAEQLNHSEEEIVARLRALGFEVARIGRDWSREEVEATVADYFEMLRLEATGIAYNKSEHNAQLRRYLQARSKASVELKHQNISAVLDQLGLPFISGYKPRTNVQALLREVVTSVVQRRGAELQQVIDAIEDRTEPGDRQYRGALVSPPKVETPQPDSHDRLRSPGKLDSAARDEHNRRLGYNGEAWVMGYERQRLADVDRSDLAEHIEWTPERYGDRIGYDIRLFEVDELARFIEVKTTNGAVVTPSFCESQ